ncbi:Uncharacterised protein [Vibrio cholerae]|nr:Uncharacterised protein [Vibrio cholerae]
MTVWLRYNAWPRTISDRPVHPSYLDHPLTDSDKRMAAPSTP